MIELKFYTDGEKVYLNNDSGITKECDLSALFGGGGSGGSSELDGADDTITLLARSGESGFSIVKWDGDLSDYVNYPLASLINDVKNGKKYIFVLTDDDEDPGSKIYPGDVYLTHYKEGDDEWDVISGESSSIYVDISVDVSNIYFTNNYFIISSQDTNTAQFYTVSCDVEKNLSFYISGVGLNEE